MVLSLLKVHYLVHYLLYKVSGKKTSSTSNVTLLLITLTRGPPGHLVFSRAREIKYAKKASSLHSVATVKLTLIFRVILELVVVAALVRFFSRSSSTRGQSFISGKSCKFVFFLVISFRLML